MRTNKHDIKDNLKGTKCRRSLNTLEIVQGKDSLWKKLSFVWNAVQLELYALFIKDVNLTRFFP